MRKYKLEISILAILAAFIVILLWDVVAFKLAFAPWILLGGCLLALLSVTVPMPSKAGTANAVGDTERYAPKFFAQIILSSVVGIVLICALAAVLNRERFSHTFDVTARKVNSLSDETSKFLSELDTGGKKVQIFCIPAEDPRDQYCEENFYLRQLYAEKSKSLQHQTLNFQNQRDVMLLQELKPTGVSRILIISSDNKRNEITGSIDESKLTNGLINVIKTKKVIYFLTGNGEPGISFGSDKTYVNLITSLKNRNYEVKEHSPLQGDIPNDSELIVAGSTSSPYPANVENVIRRFLARGGRMIFTVNPLREPGLTKLWADLGIKFDNTILVHNGGRTPEGRDVVAVNPVRPPIFIGEYSKVSPMTSEIPPNMSFGLVDTARSFTWDEKAGETSAYKTKYTKIVSAFHAAPVVVSEMERSNLPAKGPLPLGLPQSFDVNATYAVGVDVEIKGLDKLLDGVPGSKPELKPGEKAPESTDILLLGYDLAVSNSAKEWELYKTLILSPAVAHLYRDKDLVSVPVKDFSPKKFKLERKPEKFVAFFAFLPSLATALVGFYIWMRRRSA